MKNRKENLSLHIEVNGEVEYEIIPSSTKIWQDELCIHTIEYTLAQRQSFIVKLLSTNNGHLQIKKIVSNGQELQNWQLWSTNKVGDQILSTYGFMNQPGEYKFNIRYSPLIHNYITYFLSRCT